MVAMRAPVVRVTYTTPLGGSYRAGPDGRVDVVAEDVDYLIAIGFVLWQPAATDPVPGVQESSDTRGGFLVGW